MQTLISVFDDRSAARKAVDKLVRAGFARDRVHLHEAGEVHADEEAVRELGDHAMGSAEREIAMDRGVFDSLGHFFVSLFGEDDGEKATGRYGSHAQRGNSLVVVHADSDADAEAAAVILHEEGAVEVEDRPVQAHAAEPPSISDLSQQRQLREESLLADRETKEDREERAYASAMNHRDRDRPK